MIDAFRNTPLELLGKGGESEVYALDDARVLRVYKAQIPADYIVRRQDFYEQLRAQQPPFDLPLILESGTLDDRVYSVERRMGGRSFADVLPALQGADRRRALASYIEVVEQVGAIRFPERPFGELLTAGEPLQRASWPRFVADRLEQTLRVSRPDVEQDVPAVDTVLAHLRAELPALEGCAEKRLVHGDYFPGNVYIDDQLTICAVGDFGYTTVVGDPRLDLAGAIGYLELALGYQPDDTLLLMRMAVDRHGPAVVRWLDFYRLYCSFYFSTCKTDDPLTYAWCIRNLRSWLQSHRESLEHID